ncbi:M15 family metallopeptidase [Sanguibacter sp. HDW7]|uniref:M15 family metallopeptidase n=1 Tax=Sanguibacter sp. HDW7 TaxID=2714931 RepID=UPI00140791CF|nr:M15 family metallopeptidase [Sanguibacter sp. HDW7]QIK82979.1 hypothetical protein G7063_04570 [Sanguibacter sp. HDW7]
MTALVEVASDRRLAPAPASDYLRALELGAPPGITSATRDPAEQITTFLDRYRPATSKDDVGPYGDVGVWRGVRYVRISAKGTVAVPGTSLHERGNALDIPEPARAWFHQYGARFGWHNPAWAKHAGTYEPWHFEHTPMPTRDEDDMIRTTKHRTKNVALPKGQWKTAPIDDAGNTSASTTAGHFDALATLRLHGLARGAEVQARFVVVETDAAGKSARIVHRLPLTEIIGTSGDSFGQVAAKGVLALIAGKRERRLRLQLLATTAGVTLVDLDVTTDTRPA